MNATILLALLNGLWQGIALVAITMLALRFWRGRNAATTCAIWSAVYLAVALLPIVDVALQYRVTAQTMPIVSPVIALTDTSLEQPLRATTVDRTTTSPATRVVVARPDVTFVAAPPSLLSRIDSAARAIGTRAGTIAAAVALPLFVLWGLIAVSLLARLIRGYVLVLKLKRAATPLADQAVTARITAASPHRRLAIATSEQISIPCAVGFVHPMILLPAPLTDSLEPDDLARILLHELAHLQRHDDWLNAVQRTIGAIFFFQPALAYVSRQIDLTREIACDDRVLETTGEPIRYAQCLTKMVEQRVRGRVAAVPGFVFGTAQVVARVRTIVERRGAFSSRITRSAGAAALAVAFVAFAIARIQVPVVAQAVSEPTATATAGKTTIVRTQPRIQTFVIDDTPLVAPAPKPAKKMGHNALVKVAPSSPAEPLRSFENDPNAKIVVLRRVIASNDAPKTSATTIVTRDNNDIELPIDAGMRIAPLPTVGTFKVPNVSVRLSVGDDTSWAQVASPAPAASPAPPAPLAPATKYRQTYRLSAPVTIRVASPMRVDILDALEAGGYGHPSVDQLIALRNAGIDGAYLKAMSLGKGRPSLTELIDLRNKGVMPDYARGRQLHFGTNVPGNGVIELHGAGVMTPDLDQLHAFALTSEALRRLAASSRTMTADQLLQALKTGDQPTTDLAKLRAMTLMSEKLRRLAASSPNPMTMDQLMQALKAMGDQPK